MEPQGKPSCHFQQLHAVHFRSLMQSTGHATCIMARVLRMRTTAPLKWIEYGVYGDLITIYFYPKPYSVYLRLKGTVSVVRIHPVYGNPNVVCGALEKMN